MATKLNYSVSLDGSTDAFSIADHADFKPTGAFTVFGWARTTTDNYQNIIQSQSWAGGKSAGWYFLIHPTNNSIRLYSGNNTGETDNTHYAHADGTTNVLDGKWHFFVGTSDGTNLKVYVDGVLEGTTSWANHPAYAATNYVRVGCANDNGTNISFFNGNLKGVGIINGTALTQAQIATKMFQDLTGTTNLKAYYKFENNANDSSGNSHTLTGIGTPTYASTPEDVPFTYYLTASDNLTSLDLEAGSSQYAYITDANQTGLDLTGDFTFETWAKFESTPSSGATMQFLSKDDNTAGDRSYQWSLWNDSGTLKISILIFAGDSTYDLVTWNYTPTLGVWNHYAVSCDISNAASSEFILYIDKVSQGNGTVVTNGNVSTIQSGSANFEIGRLGDASGYFDGKVGITRVFNDIRTPTEIGSDIIAKTVSDANLVVEWGFDGNTLDNTANNNDLTLVNAPYYAPDPAFDVNARHSLDLELGSSQYAYVGDNTALSITGDITIEASVKFESKPDDTITFGGKYNTTGNQVSYLFCLVGNENNLAFLYSTDGSYQAGNDIRKSWTPTLGVWYHVAVTLDVSESTVKFYVDGVQQGTDGDSAGTSIYDSTTAFGIGANAYNSWSGFFDGKIKEVRVWNDVRTETELLANKDKQLVGDEANLVGYWRLNNNYVDLTSNNNNLTPVNTPTFSWIVPFDGSITTSIKSVSNLAYASIKSVSGTAIASVKKVAGLA